MEVQNLIENVLCQSQETFLRKRSANDFITCRSRQCFTLLFPFLVGGFGSCIWEASLLLMSTSAAPTGEEPAAKAVPEEQLCPACLQGTRGQLEPCRGAAAAQWLDGSVQCSRNSPSTAMLLNEQPALVPVRALPFIRNHFCPSFPMLISPCLWRQALLAQVPSNTVCVELRYQAHLPVPQNQSRGSLSHHHTDSKP